jgi:hypothetical protein
VDEHIANFLNLISEDYFQEELERKSSPRIWARKPTMFWPCMMRVDDGRGYRKNEGQRRIGQKKSNSVKLRGVKANLPFFHLPSTLSLSLFFSHSRSIRVSYHLRTTFG